jgi:hypothetical protein
VTDRRPTLVSVVIATHDRPDALVVAVRSALGQEGPVEVVVVGDRCGAGTADALAAVDDARVRYVNLPQRCGEQSIPNAVGTELARGSWVAFLNHDDVWFPDHLARARDVLAATGASWYLGGAQFAYRSRPGPGPAEPHFTDRTPAARTLRDAFSRTFSYLEPVSSWVVQRDLLLRAGQWRPARACYRTPVVDLGLRLWRHGGEPAISDAIGVLKILGAVQAVAGRTYGEPSPEHAAVWSALRDAVAAGVPPQAAFPLDDGQTVDRRADVAGDATGAGARTSAVLRRVVGPRSAAIYRRTGVDVLALVTRAAGAQRGWYLQHLLQHRTGETALPDTDRDAMIRWALARPAG